MSRTHQALVAITLWGMALCSGCATLDIPWFDRMPEASRRNPVMQIVCMWEPSEGRDPQGAPCRGFAGQLLFLGNRGGTPVAVNGDVSVYVFDDIGTEAEQGTPIHQFNFDARSWNRHLKEGSLGPAYHCFIPYTRPGNLEAICTVRVKYMPSDAPEVLSDPSHITMRGRKRNATEAEVPGGPLVSVLTRPQPQVGPRTTTIALQERNSPFRDSQIANGETVDPIKKVLDDYKAEQALHQPRIVEPVASRRLRLSDSSVQPVNYESSSAESSGVEPATFTSDGDAPQMQLE